MYYFRFIRDYRFFNEVRGLKGKGAKGTVTEGLLQCPTYRPEWTVYCLPVRRSTSVDEVVVWCVRGGWSDTNRTLPPVTRECRWVTVWSRGDVRPVPRCWKHSGELRLLTLPTTHGPKRSPRRRSSQARLWFSYRLIRPTPFHGLSGETCRS